MSEAPEKPPTDRENAAGRPDDSETAAELDAEDEAPQGDEPASEEAEPRPSDAAGEDFARRDPRALGLDLTVGGLVLLAVALLTLGASTLLVLLASVPVWVYLPAVAVPSILVFPLLILPRLRHQRYRYRADERGLEIHQGVWWHTQRFIARSRLQHSDIAQGPLQRRLELADLIVHTAGTHEAQTKIEGLALETARAVRDRLTGAGAGADETDGV